MHRMGRLYVFAFGIAFIAGAMLIFALVTQKVPGGGRGVAVTKQENPAVYWRTVIILAIVTVGFAALGLWGMHGGQQ